METAIDIALREFAAIGIGTVVDVDAVFEFVDGFQIGMDIVVTFNADTRSVAFQRPVVEFVNNGCAGGNGSACRWISIDACSMGYVLMF